MQKHFPQFSHKRLVRTLQRMYYLLQRTHPMALDGPSSTTCSRPRGALSGARARAGARKVAAAVDEFPKFFPKTGISNPPSCLSWTVSSSSHFVKTISLTSESDPPAFGGNQYLVKDVKHDSEILKI